MALEQFSLASNWRMAGLHTVDDVLAYMDIPMPENDDLSEDDFADNGKEDDGDNDEGDGGDGDCDGSDGGESGDGDEVRMVMGIIVVMGTIAVMVMTAATVFLSTLSIRAAHGT